VIPEGETAVKINVVWPEGSQSEHQLSQDHGALKISQN
jgi:hypothetical protein